LNREDAKDAFGEAVPEGEEEKRRKRKEGREHKKTQLNYII